MNGCPVESRRDGAVDNLLFQVADDNTESASSDFVRHDLLERMIRESAFRSGLGEANHNNSGQEGDEHQDEGERDAMSTMGEKDFHNYGVGMSGIIDRKHALIDAYVSDHGCRQVSRSD